MDSTVVYVIITAIQDVHLDNFFDHFEIKMCKCFKCLYFEKNK